MEPVFVFTAAPHRAHYCLSFTSGHIVTSWWHNKGKALESSRNHPCPLGKWKNCLPQNWSLGAKRFGGSYFSKTIHEPRYQVSQLRELTTTHP